MKKYIVPMLLVLSLTTVVESDTACGWEWNPSAIITTPASWVSKSVTSTSKTVSRSTKSTFKTVSNSTSRAWKKTAAFLDPFPNKPAAATTPPETINEFFAGKRPEE